jgi:hypothetical protein
VVLPPGYSCRGDEVLDSDPNTVVVWSVEGRTANGTVSFDLPDSPILTGVYGQRLCLGVLDTIKIRDPVCVAQAPILGFDPSTCPLVDRYQRHKLAAKVILPERPVAPPPGPPPPVIDPPAPDLTKARAKAAAKTALGDRFGRVWRKRKRLSFACARKNDATFSCTARWTAAGVRRAAKVTVRLTGGVVSTRVRTLPGRSR